MFFLSRRRSPGRLGLRRDERRHERQHFHGGRTQEYFGVAVDSGGTLFASDIFNVTIREFTSTGADVGVLASAGGGTFRGVTIGPDGFLYASYDPPGLFVPGVIDRINPSNGTTTTFANTFSGPLGLGFDAAGNLFVAFGNRSYAEYDSSGNLVRSFANNNPQALISDAGFLAVPPAAVPEPSTMALLCLAAVSLIGFRRR
jgi:hypothetical protein